MSKDTKMHTGSKKFDPGYYSAGRALAQNLVVLNLGLSTLDNLSQIHLQLFSEK